MTTTTLRKSGGSHIVTVPQAFVAQNRLHSGAPLKLAIQGDALVLRPLRQRPTLAALLKKCDSSAPLPKADAEWLGARAAGRELL